MKYWIGDLCYILPEDIYHDCILSKEGEWRSKNGISFAYGSTAYGDGLYFDNHGNQYPVDAGIIGIVKLDGSFEPEPDYESDGNIFEFKDLPTVDIIGGVFRFGGGHVFIDTTENEEDDEYV